MQSGRGRWVAAIAVAVAMLGASCSSSPPDVSEEYQWVLDDDYQQIRDCGLLEVLINVEVDRILGAGDDAELVNAAEIQYRRIVGHRDDLC